SHRSADRCKLRSEPPIAVVPVDPGREIAGAVADHCVLRQRLAKPPNHSSQMESSGGGERFQEGEIIRIRGLGPRAPALPAGFAQVEVGERLRSRGYVGMDGPRRLVYLAQFFFVGVNVYEHLVWY